MRTESARLDVLHSDLSAFARLSRDWPHWNDEPLGEHLVEFAASRNGVWWLTGGEHE